MDEKQTKIVENELKTSCRVNWVELIESDLVDSGESSYWAGLTQLAWPGSWTHLDVNMAQIDGYE